MYSPNDRMKKRMEKYLHGVYKLFDEVRGQDDCWLHPTPPLARGDGRASGTIPCKFVWTDTTGRHCLRVNVGIVALIVERRITQKQIDGYVNESWHLSHLCGNWTCCNWRHMTVERGQTNISRNKCFPNAGPCSHDPACMKDRKRRFLVTVDISNTIRSAIEFTRKGGFLTVGCQYPTTSTGWYVCGVCGKGVPYCGEYRICPSLTSLVKSQAALEELELCTQPSEQVLEAILYLMQIVDDLIRGEKASDAAALERVVIRVVNQREMDVPVR